MNPLQQIADNLAAAGLDHPAVDDAVIKLTNWKGEDDRNLLVNNVRNALREHYDPEAGLVGSVALLSAKLTNMATHPSRGVVDELGADEVRDLWMATDADGITTAEHLRRFAKRIQAAALPADTVTVQEAWEWAGGNPGITATRADLEAALRDLDAVCDEADAAPPAKSRGVVDEALDWLDEEVSATSTRYHGDPSYDHDAYWMKQRCFDLIRQCRKVFSAQAALPAVPEVCGRCKGRGVVDDNVDTDDCGGSIGTIEPCPVCVDTPAATPAHDQPEGAPLAFNCSNAVTGKPGTRCYKWCGSHACISLAATPAHDQPDGEW